MGILGAADTNTPLKSKARRWLTKKPQVQHAQMPGTPIASSESPVQGSLGQKSPESLLGTAMRAFEKDEKLGVTFQDTGGRLSLQVIGLKVGSQGLELGVKVRGCLLVLLHQWPQALTADDNAYADGLAGVGG